MAINRNPRDMAGILNKLKIGAIRGTHLAVKDCKCAQGLAFPSSSHMFRDLLPKLADKFHVIAPDYLGFGYSDMPSASEFEYTFDNLAAHVEELLLNNLGLKTFRMYVQDYRAPIGYRIASKHPQANRGKNCVRTETPTRRKSVPDSMR